MALNSLLRFGSGVSVVSPETTRISQHTYVPFQPLPAIAIDELSRSVVWLREQSALREVVRMIQDPRFDDAETVGALIQYLEGDEHEPGIGFININGRIVHALPIRVRALPNGQITEITPTNQPREMFRPLIAAVRARKLLTAHHLLSLGADVQQASEYGGVTPIMYAVALGDEQMTELLLDYDANLLKVDADGRTALVHGLNTPAVSVPTILSIIKVCPAMTRHIPHRIYSDPPRFWRDMVGQLLDVQVIDREGFTILTSALTADAPTPAWLPVFVTSVAEAVDAAGAEAAVGGRKRRSRSPPDQAQLPQRRLRL